MDNTISLKPIWVCLLFSSYTLDISAETIYQWSNPWGQIQYSKTPVPGATVSDLTELPETIETTEQQKQNAMVTKLQSMRQKNLRRQLQSATQQQSIRKAVIAKNRCYQLRILKADLNGQYLWQHALFGIPLAPNYYNFLYHDLSNEIDRTCQ